MLAIKRVAYQEGQRDERQRCAEIIRKHVEFWQKNARDDMRLECENILIEITQGKS